MTRSKKRKSNGLQPINLNISQLFSSEHMQRLSGVGILRRRWSDIVGNMMAERSEPISIEPQPDGSLGLIIAVNHSVIAQQIRMLHEEIRIACFKQCKIQGLSKVWTVVQAGAGIRHEKKQPIINKIHCSDLRMLAESLKDVEDKALRRTMFQAGTAQLTFSNLNQGVS